MWYAEVDGERRKAFVGGRGICRVCDAVCIAKCGERVRAHWAHIAGADRRSCDHWWENETEWHREWKARFPEDWREVVVGAHRADIRRPDGCVIELQHSSIAADDVRAREQHYGRMIWLLDGKTAKLETCDRGDFHSFRLSLFTGLRGATKRVFVHAFDPDEWGHEDRIFAVRKMHLRENSRIVRGWGHYIEMSEFLRLCVQ